MLSEDPADVFHFILLCYDISTNIYEVFFYMPATALEVKAVNKTDKTLSNRSLPPEEEKQTIKNTIQRISEGNESCINCLGKKECQGIVVCIK